MSNVDFDDDLDSKSLKELKSEHQTLESKLEDLQTPRSMSPEEEYEMQVIKKRKLSIKDKIMTLQDTG